MSNESFLRVELIQQYDITNQKYVEDRGVKVNTKALQAGLINDIGITEFAVLMVIASFCDIEGEAFPSQRKLAEILGLSKTTVNKAVTKLLETKVNGVPILSRELESLGSKRQFSVYSLGVAEEKEVVKKKTARDFVAKFKAMFEEEFGFPYVVNYARDTSLMKKKLMADFTEEQVEQLVEYTIKNYTKKWAKDAYPYPTIAMLCSWLANAVMKELQQEQKKADEVESLKQATAVFINADNSKINALIDL